MSENRRPVNRACQRAQTAKMSTITRTVGRPGVPVNRNCMAIAWLPLKKVLPSRLGHLLQGAGFNIAYIAWFAAMAITVGPR
jgi:hypothetical protein